MKVRKNTKYFRNLEKRQFKQGTISQIKINDHAFVTSDKEILTKCMSFYKNLYSSKSTMYVQNDTTFFPEREDESIIQEQDLIVCEGALTEKECLEAPKDMGTEKTPGTDGLPAECYKVFWKDISAILIRALGNSEKKNYQTHF